MIGEYKGAACITLKGSIEEKIYQRQISKSGLAEVMEARAGSAQTAVKFSSEELKVCSYVYKPPDTHTTIPGVMVFEHTRTVSHGNCTRACTNGKLEKCSCVRLACSC